jgi:hypothetical protein
MNLCSKTTKTEVGRNIGRKGDSFFRSTVPECFSTKSGMSLNSRIGVLALSRPNTFNRIRSQVISKIKRSSIINDSVC